MKPMHYITAGLVAAGLALAAPAQARPLAAGPAADSPLHTTTVGHRGHHGGGVSIQSGWNASDYHHRNYRSHLNYNYGPNYRHQQHGHVQPFAHFRKSLHHAGYSGFQKARFHGHSSHWTPHYYVNAHDPYGKQVALRVCAYTGQVLGYRHY